MIVQAQNHSVIFTTLGECIVNHKEDFVEMLKESGVSCSMKDEPKELAEKYVENVDKNPALMIASAYMCAYYSTDISFDGEKSVDNNQVHGISKSLYDFFSIDDNFYEFAGGLLGGLVSKGKDIAQDLYQQKQKQKTAGVDMLSQKSQAKQQMVNAILEQQRMKQEMELKKAEDQKKKRRTWIIVGSVAGALILGTAIFLIIKSKKKGK